MEIYSLLYLFISSLLAFGLGLFVNYVFLKSYLNKRRPIIEISPHISKENNIYVFKFVNKTKTDIIDVHLSLMFYVPSGDKSGKTLNGKNIQISWKFYPSIPGEKKDDPYNLHAKRIHTEENLNNQWTNESSFIRLIITAKHSLTGLSKTFQHDFLSAQCITNKKFDSGNNLDVV